MILFDLQCAKNHRFEGWFKTGDAFEKQAKAGKVECPTCGNTKVKKALSAPALLKGGVSSSKAEGIAIKLREAMTELRKHVEANAENVGKQFPEEARKIHYGETEERPIYGEASPDEAEELHEEGIEIVPIPWPSRQDS